MSGLRRTGLVIALLAALASCGSQPAANGAVRQVGPPSPITVRASGVASLLASQNRSAAQIRKRIQSTATDIGPPGRDNLFGTGLLNARAAVGTSLTSARPAGADRSITTTAKK